jgi:hypothetical protein
MADCDIHPHCQSQGCAADPDHCQRACDLRNKRAGNAGAAALARMAQYARNVPHEDARDRL